MPDLSALFVDLPLIWPFRSSVAIESPHGMILLSARRCFRYQGGEAVPTGGLVLWAMIPNQAIVHELHDTLKVRIGGGWELQPASRAAHRLLDRAMVATELAAARQGVGGVLRGLPDVLIPAVLTMIGMGWSTEITQLSLADCRRWQAWAKEELIGI